MKIYNYTILVRDRIPKLMLIVLLLIGFQASSQQKHTYWNSNTQLIPWRLNPEISEVTYLDLDKDGDPDILKAKLNNTVQMIWVDDDDDMKSGDQTGDTDSDCLLIDKNSDGIFAGPGDLSIDWSDENGDGKADIQLVVNNGGTKVRNFFDWNADYMYVLDVDKDEIMHYIDWNKIAMQAWEHNGHANFFKDYNGNSTFLKMHASSFRMDDMRFNWENPFIFYDEDNDKLTEMAIRLLDSPNFRQADPTQNGFDKVDKEIDVKFTKIINYAALTWDLDNDSEPGNEFDFDMSLLFKGKGFGYEKQAHYFKSLIGLPAANSFFYDARWRKIDTLFYPDRNVAYNLIFNQGDWQECHFVFDEDDDCNRWERVEFYEPLDVFKIGGKNGGLDNNRQADAVGDRGEFDLDNSGKGRLYISAFDGRLHLYGAEWGAWRIDQTAFSYQGFGGLYDRWNKGRLQIEPAKFASIKYTDVDKNGFIDLVGYDLDGDRIYEDQVSFQSLGIDDCVDLIEPKTMDYKKVNKLFKNVAENSWKKSQQILKVAHQYQINTSWYAFYKNPNSIQEKYSYGYWLAFYLYQDLRYLARSNKDLALVKAIDKAYYSGNWTALKK